MDRDHAPLLTDLAGLADAAKRGLDALGHRSHFIGQPPAPDPHEGMTRMLFVDAIVGVGFPSSEAGAVALMTELAEFIGTKSHPAWRWIRPALESLPTPTLQDLYTKLKMFEVTTHAG